MLSRPSTVTEVLAALAANTRAVIVGGGTDVLADQNRGRDPQGYVVLRGVAGLRGTERQGDTLGLGSMTTVADLLSDPDIAEGASVLRQAARSMASRQVRERATVGGNICAGGGDRTLVPALLALDASVDVVDPAGTRSLSLSDFAAYGLSTSIVTRVSITLSEGPQVYYRVGPRNAMCYATAAVALVVDEAQKQVRLALGGVAPTSVRATEAEAFAAEGIDWSSRSVSERLAEEFGRLAASATDPVTDPVASADYRRHAVSVMSRRALKHAFEEVTT